jgi:general stress protein 13
MKPFRIGDIIKVRVTGIEKYGIFVRTYNDYSGLIHISEIDNSFIRSIYNYVSLDEIIYANVIGVDDVSRQLNLSIKNMNYNNSVNSKVKESVSGFLPLSNNLDRWIEEKIEEMKKDY